jgi:hypothetical protein
MRYGSVDYNLHVRLEELYLESRFYPKYEGGTFLCNVSNDLPSPRFQIPESVSSLNHAGVLHCLRLQSQFTLRIIQTHKKLCGLNAEFFNVE